MTEQFCYKVYLPSKLRFVNYNELTNREYLSILKFNKNKDRDNLSKYLEHLIRIKAAEPITNLHRIDKFCIILTMMIVSIKPFYKLIGTCEETEKTYDIEVDLPHILDLISNVSYSPISTYIGDSIVIYYNYPTDILVDVESYNVFNILDKIQFNKKIYTLSDYSPDDRQKIIDKLPAPAFSDIRSSIQLLIDRYSDIVFFKQKSPHVEDSEELPYPLSMTDNLLFDFICIMLGDDLRGFYELQHSMSANFSFSHEYFLSTTPAEVQTFYNFMKRDIQSRKDNIKKAESQNLDPAQSINPIPGL